MREKLTAIMDDFYRREEGRSIALYFAGPDFAGPDIARPGAGAEIGDRAEIGLLGMGEDILRPVASIMKVPVMMALYDMAAQGLCDLDQNIEVSALGETRYVSILQAFDAGRRLSLREIIALSLMTSDNPCAVYLTDLVGFERVNSLLREIGCDPQCQMSVGFREGELGPKNRANQMRARDVISLFQHLQDEPRYSGIITALRNNLRGTRMPALLPENVDVAHKTGSLNGVINDAGIIFAPPIHSQKQEDSTQQEAGKSFILAFLTDGQQDPVTTSEAIARCTEALYHAICD